MLLYITLHIRSKSILTSVGIENEKVIREAKKIVPGEAL
jgi:hypothetical protein